MVNLEPYSKELYSHGERREINFLQIRKARALDFDQVCGLIAHRSTLTEGEVEFVLREVVQVIIENIEDGRGTQLGPLGTVDLSLEAESRPTSEELTLSTVKRIKLLFKPSAKIKQALKEVRFRVKREYGKKSEE